MNLNKPISSGLNRLKSRKGLHQVTHAPAATIPAATRDNSVGALPSKSKSTYSIVNDPNSLMNRSKSLA